MERKQRAETTVLNQVNPIARVRKSDVSLQSAVEDGSSSTVVLGEENSTQRETDGNREGPTVIVGSLAGNAGVYLVAASESDDESDQGISVHHVAKGASASAVDMGEETLLSKKPNQIFNN